MAQAANSAGTVAIRGALLVVLLVGALVCTAEATRDAGLVVAAAPVASVHTSSIGSIGSILGCMMGCGTQGTMCGISCLNKPFLHSPQCAVICTANEAKCILGCGSPAAHA
jgi:hypothetical protein